MNTDKIHIFWDKLKNSSLARDSFWAVFGNGLGNFLLLLSGILIARILGKNLYGEYGIVKSTMFLMALFATFAIGDTSTKFVAEYIHKDYTKVRAIVRASFKIVFLFSTTMCLLLCVFAHQIANFVNEPQLVLSFRFLGFIIVFRALGTVSSGLLGGFKDYKSVGINNIVSGIVMIGLAIPLSLVYGLFGALWGLLLSQVCLCLLNIFHVGKLYRLIKDDTQEKLEKEIVKFSFPFAVNEFIYSAVVWGENLLIAKYATLGEFGMFSACLQWNSIILFMPGLLGNVVLSHLSTTAGGDSVKHDNLIRKMLLVNFICTLLPLLVVILLSPFIEQYYGQTFDGMRKVLCIIICGTLFTCLTRVFQFNLISEGKKWVSLTVRSTHNIIEIILVFAVLKLTGGEDAAMKMAILTVFISILSFVMNEEVYRWGKRSVNTL